jgi:hypothetical protein
MVIVSDAWQQTPASAGLHGASSSITMKALSGCQPAPKRAVILFKRGPRGAVEFFADSSLKRRLSSMQLVDRIEDQIKATGMPLFSITLAAVPCPDTPVILTLHWHAFVREKLADVEGATPVAYTPAPSSALQINDRWRDLIEVDDAALEAAWRLGAWDMARAERPACARPGAAVVEPAECRQAFAAYPHGVHGRQLVVSEAPDADELLHVAQRHGYLCWMFRPVRGGIWGEVANDATLLPDGRRAGPCPKHAEPPRCDGRRRTVVQLGASAERPS